VTETVHLLTSPDAGRGRGDRAFAAIRAELEAEGRAVVELTGPTADASATAVTDAVRDGASRLVVAGGDGLVHIGVQAVAGTSTALGVVPVGTGNDFARGLGLPDDPVAATRIALGPTQAIDALRVRETWVASVATFGFAGDVNGRANRLRFPRGPSRYTVATVAELPRLRRRRVRLTVDDEMHEFDAALVAVANTAWFGGGMEICPDADPADGLLDITVVGDVGRIELLRFFRLVFSGAHLDHPDVHTLRGQRVTIEDDAVDLWGDGEPLGATPAVVDCQPGVVQIALPPAPR
jgi:diacylglycerol kinase (ATP)